MKRAAEAAVAALASLAACAADMASQKWVEMRLAQVRAEIEANIVSTGGVTQSWVESTVSNAVANSKAEIAATAREEYANGVRTVSVGSGEKALSISIEDASVYALKAVEATGEAAARGVTNGMFFVWNGDGTYVNGCGQAIATTANACFLWDGLESVRTNGIDVFEGFFGVVGAKMQPSAAMAATNAVKAASAGWRASMMHVAKVVGEMMAGSAYADALNVLTPEGWPDSWIPNSWDDVHSGVAKIAFGEGQYDVVVGEDGVVDRETLPTELQGDNFFLSILPALELALQAKLAIAELADQLKGVKFSEIEITDPETGASTTATPAPTSTASNYGETKNYYARNLINRVATDGASVTTERRTVVVGNREFESDVLKLFGRPSTALANAGLFPYWSRNSTGGGTSLGWIDVGGLFDGESVTVEKADETPHDVVPGGIGLAGWGTPDRGRNRCDVTLASMIGSGSEADDHYVLTRYGTGEGADLHYTRVGLLSDMGVRPDGRTIVTNRTGAVGMLAVNLDDRTLGVGTDGKIGVIGNAGSALRIVGTEGGSGVVVGSGADTNTVAFASADDSNVRVWVERDGMSGARVVIGVYYK